mmetsp:Transcript_20267/g.30079  ORF Transcript_20267/g.30079 Transcript_20267/m.30079 type:complete len:215 (-) Transcript_20267:171-815(-)
MVIRVSSSWARRARCTKPSCVATWNFSNTPSSDKAASKTLIWMSTSSQTSPSLTNSVSEGHSISCSSPEILAWTRPSKLVVSKCLCFSCCCCLLLLLPPPRKFRRCCRLLLLASSASSSFTKRARKLPDAMTMARSNSCSIVVCSSDGAFLRLAMATLNSKVTVVARPKGPVGERVGAGDMDGARGMHRHSARSNSVAVGMQATSGIRPISPIS